MRLRNMGKAGWSSNMAGRHTPRRVITSRHRDKQPLLAVAEAIRGTAEHATSPPAISCTRRLQRGRPEIRCLIHMPAGTRGRRALRMYTPHSASRHNVPLPD